jgi:nucleoside diphosphate-linked moiety X motif protein 19
MGQKVGNYDYKVMLLKRSAKMRVAPGFHVFPGGGIDFNDHSLNWLDVLQHKSKNLTELRNSYKSIITATSLGSLLKEDDEASREPTLPAEIAFRLCAIRETFEETGLLLAEKKRAGLKPDGRLKQWGSSYSVSELSAWQDRIRKDSSQFRAMCLELDVVPDLYGLHEWANWVTPTREKFRFNTFFFTCFLNQSPAPVDLKIDSNEIESLNVAEL